MSSQQSVVQQASDLWVIRAAVLNKLTIRTVWLSTMSGLLPSVSPWEFLGGALWSSHPFKQHCWSTIRCLTSHSKSNISGAKKLKLGSILYVFARYPTVFILLASLPQFQTIKVCSYIPWNAQGSHKYIVRVPCRFTRCLMSKQSM